MKHRFDKTRVAYTVAYACAALAMLEISLWLNGPARESESFRYLQQLTYITTVILAIITANSIKKLIPKTLRRAVLDKFLYAMRKVATGISKVSRRILRVFGINLERYKRHKDEKSFIFDIQDMNIFKKLSSFKSSVKWRDLNENAEKIRFIYIKYMVKMIKNGYKLPPFLTPFEVREDLALDEEKQADDRELFDLYTGARYSGGSVNITDAQVETALAVVNGKKK